LCLWKIINYKVQCIYFDPPYGIKFNSNFQWSTRSRDVKDGDKSHITREPEQVRAFRDTWKDGIHSYLTYLRDRLTVARDLRDVAASWDGHVDNADLDQLVAARLATVGGDDLAELYPNGIAPPPDSAQARFWAWVHHDDEAEPSVSSWLKICGIVLPKKRIQHLSPNPSATSCATGRSNTNKTKIPEFRGRTSNSVCAPSMAENIIFIPQALADC
jgi:hypothetical protein